MNGSDRDNGDGFELLVSLWNSSIAFGDCFADRVPPLSLELIRYANGKLLWHANSLPTGGSAAEVGEDGEDAAVVAAVGQ